MKRFNRRTFVTLLVAAPLPTLLSNTSVADDPPKLEESDTMAKTLGYINASEKPEQLCKGCQLYQAEPDVEWGPCIIFPGKVVNANGWCKSWVVKAS